MGSQYEKPNDPYNDLTDVNLEATFADVLAKMDPETHDRIRKAASRNEATHIALYECHYLGSRHLGERFVLMVGPTCTYRTPDSLLKLMSRRGLASDMSSLVLVAPIPPETIISDREIVSDRKQLVDALLKAEDITESGD